jgi:hypothetical protein
VGGRRRVGVGSGTANGTKIQLFTCDGTAAQQWTVGADATIRALGKYMDVTAAGAANQQWTTP